MKNINNLDMVPEQQCGVIFEEKKFGPGQNQLCPFWGPKIKK